MDAETDGAERSKENLECRLPTMADVSALCRELNLRGARYVVIGGFAIIAAGYARLTGDIDLIVASDPENEEKVFSALETLPDKAVRQLDKGELRKYIVIRVADEILVDLMVSAGGIDYEEASKEITIHQYHDVSIPFASPRLLWRMKARTYREKDGVDLLFLREWFAQAGQSPPVG